MAKAKKIIQQTEITEGEIQPSASVPSVPSCSNPEPVSQNYHPPKMGAAEVMASFGRSMEIVRARRLEKLSRKFPEIARALKQS